MFSFVQNTVGGVEGALGVQSPGERQNDTGTKGIGTAMSVGLKKVL